MSPQRRGFADVQGVERFTTQVEVPLVGDIDLPSVLANVPTDFALKGMFFTRCVGALASNESSDETWSPRRTTRDAWADVAKELVEAPPDGTYHAFESYPMSDYVRIFDRVARARFPGSTREAYRLLARGEVEVFAGTTLGKVTFSMLRDPEVALARYPELLAVLSKGPVATAQRTASSRVVVTFQRHFGSTEYTIGMLEGLAMAFDVVPSLDIDVAADRRTTITVRW